MYGLKCSRDGPQRPYGPRGSPPLGFRRRVAALIVVVPDVVVVVGFVVVIGADARSAEVGLDGHKGEGEFPFRLGGRGIGGIEGTAAPREGAAVAAAAAAAPREGGGGVDTVTVVVRLPCRRRRGGGVEALVFPFEIAVVAAIADVAKVAAGLEDPRRHVGLVLRDGIDLGRSAAESFRGWKRWQPSGAGPSFGARRTDLAILVAVVLVALVAGVVVVVVKKVFEAFTHLSAIKHGFIVRCCLVVFPNFDSLHHHVVRVCLDLSCCVFCDTLVRAMSDRVFMRNRRGRDFF